VWRAAELSEWPDSGVTLPEGFGPEKLRIADPGTARIRVIGMHPDQLVTDALEREPTVVGGAAVADAERDLLKLAVIERHRGSGRIGLGFVENFRFRGGALASTVGHDAHNLAVVGDDDADMVLAARTLAEVGGGQCVVARGRVLAVLALPIAGLMSDREPGDVIDAQHALLAAARELGCPHADPFMPLSFLVLPVIPALKLTDLGLVDVTRFAVTGLGINGGDA
jgi:adenine deaminase